MEPAEVPGYRLILPSTVRHHLELCDALHPVTLDATTGQTVTVDDAVPPPRPARPETAGKAAPDSVVPELLDRVLAAPVTVRDLSSAQYRPSERLVRYLQVRDRTCVFPGCHRRITDKDHRIPWPLGPTSPQNLACLFRHHHRAKHTSFTVEQLPDGTHRWTSRSGHTWH